MTKINRLPLTLLVATALSPLTAAPLMLPAAAYAAEAADDIGLGEIIVTATRREADVQRIGIAVSAMSAETLEKYSVSDANELTALVPGFSYTDTGSPVVGLISIRGVSQNDFAGHLEAPNTFYIDEVYLPAISATSLQFFDVSRVEILKGPQGTLFGRNSTGGLLHIITNKPTQEFEGYASLTVAERDQIKLEGAISGPLSDTVRGRLAAYRNKADGYFKNDLGKDLNEDDIVAGRAHLEMTPNEDLDIRLSADIYKQRPSTTGGAYATAGAPNADGLGEHLPPGSPTAYGYVDADGDPFTGSFDQPGNIEKRLWSVSGRVAYDFGDISLISLTSYSDTESDYIEDNDLSPVPFTEFNQTSNSEHFTQELRLEGETENFNWITGVYYLNIDGQYAQGFNILAIGTNLQSASALKTESWSVFGQGEYAVSDTVSLIAGARWTTDTKKYQYEANCTGPACPGFVLPDTIGSAGLVTDKHTDDGWSARLELDWRPMEDLLLYGSVSRGYKAFSYNAGFAGQAPLAGLRFNGEKLTAFEVGNKLDFWEKRARLNISAFYYDYKDFQAFDQRGVTFTLYNTDARIYGLDAEFTVRPVESLTLFAGASLLDTKVDDVPIGAGLQDREATQSPSVTFSFAATQVFSLNDNGDISVTANAVYTDEFYSQLSNAPVTLVPSNWLVNARIAYTSPSDRFEFAVFAKNLMDEKRQIYAFDITNIGLVENNYGEPRQFGAELRVNF